MFRGAGRAAGRTLTGRTVGMLPSAALRRKLRYPPTEPGSSSKIIRDVLEGRISPQQAENILSSKKRWGAKRAVAWGPEAKTYNSFAQLLADKTDGLTTEQAKNLI